MGTMFPCGLLRRSSSRYLLARSNWREECIRGFYDEFEGLVSGDTTPPNYLSRSSSLLLNRSLLSPGIRLLALLIGLSALLRRLPLLATLLALLGCGTIGLLAPLLCGLALLRLLAPLLCGLTGLAGVLPPLVASHTLLLTPLLLALLGSSAVLLLSPLLATLLALRGYGTIGLTPLLCRLALLRPLTPLRRRGRLLSRCRGNVRGTPLSGSRSISLLAIADSLLRGQRLSPLLRCSRWLLARKWHVALSLALPGLLWGQRLSPLLLLRLLLHGGCAVLRLLTPLLGSLRGLLRGHRRVTGLRLLYVRRWCRSRCRRGSLWLDLRRWRRLVLRKRCRRRSVLRLSLRLCRGRLRALLRVTLRFLCRYRAGNGHRIGLILRFGLCLFGLIVLSRGNSLFDRCSFFGRCSFFRLRGREGLGLRFLSSLFRLAHRRQCRFCHCRRLNVWRASGVFSYNRLLGLCWCVTCFRLCGELGCGE